MKEFRFFYFTLNNVITIDEFALNLKSGPFIKKQFQFTELQHFYVFDNKDYRSVYFVYVDDKGKLKKHQVFSTPAEIGFTELVQELQQRFPQKSLNHLSEAEAFKAMKASNPKKWAPVVAFLIITLVMAGIFYPGLVHYFDFGQGNATATALMNENYSGSRNVRVSGILLDEALQETNTTTKNGSTTTRVSVYVPMVDENWQEGQPVKIVLSFDELTQGEYSALFNKDSHLGVIRNIAWEGLDKSQVDFFKRTYGLAIADDALLIEITNKTHNDEYAFFGLLSVLVILGIVFFIVARKQKSR